MTTFLKKLREKQGISQDFLAKRIGVSRPTYVQIEAGKRKLLVEEAQTFAKFFGLSLDDFLAGKENLEPKVKLAKTIKKVKVLDI